VNHCKRDITGKELIISDVLECVSWFLDEMCLKCGRINRYVDGAIKMESIAVESVNREVLISPRF
jgi:hypothetical protein